MNKIIELIEFYLLVTSVPDIAIQWINDQHVKCKFDLEKIKYQINNHQSINIKSESFGLLQPYQINESYRNCSHSDEINLFVKKIKTLNEFVVNLMGNDQSLFLSHKQFENSINSLDIVTSNSTRTNCFTKK